MQDTTMIDKTIENDPIEMARVVDVHRRITSALVQMYFSCLYVDMNTRTYERIHVADEIAPYVPETGTLLEYVDIYTRKLVIPYDMETIYREFSVEAVRSHLMERDSYDYEYQARTSWGDIWCRIAAIPVDRNPDGTSHHVIIAMQDITEQARHTEHTNDMLREAVVSAEAANSAKSDFMSRMSHDIRMPLNGIIGMTAIAAEHLDDRERVTDALAKIASAGQHLLALVNDILDLGQYSGNDPHAGGGAAAGTGGSRGRYLS